MVKNYIAYMEKQEEQGGILASMSQPHLETAFKRPSGYVLEDEYRILPVSPANSLSQAKLFHFLIYLRGLRRHRISFSSHDERPTSPACAKRQQEWTGLLAPLFDCYYDQDYKRPSDYVLEDEERILAVSPIPRLLHFSQAMKFLSFAHMVWRVQKAYAFLLVSR